ncbi:unnamed protein product [Cylindrotheca closterium]|uniref:Uncharacterized protein n=1 Tax=Cylindrotheca closterium TaxID=2856 RepID=A0AAD2FU34_9STRA|nr:unnamed protein product [Cylindrotheca closterium]
MCEILLTEPSFPLSKTVAGNSSWRTNDYFHQKIQSCTFPDPNPIKELVTQHHWDKNEFYGEAGGERRETFSRFLTDKVRRKGFGWKEYVDLLHEREVDMSANTETQLATELQAKGGPNDAVVNDARAVAFAVLDSANEKKTTLNLLFLLKILTLPWTTLRNAHDKARDKPLQEDLI